MTAKKPQQQARRCKEETRKTRSKRRVVSRRIYACVFRVYTSANQVGLRICFAKLSRRFQSRLSVRGSHLTAFDRKFPSLHPLAALPPSFRPSSASFPKPSRSSPSKGSFAKSSRVDGLFFLPDWLARHAFTGCMSSSQGSASHACFGSLQASSLKSSSGQGASSKRARQRGRRKGVIHASCEQVISGAKKLLSFFSLVIASCDCFVGDRSDCAYCLGCSSSLDPHFESHETE